MEVSDMLITTALILQVWVQLVAGQDYRQECSAWDDVVSLLNQEDEEMVMTCTRNHQCTGADCSGKYQYKEFMNNQKKEVEFCFGVALHPCRRPTDLHFYVETPHNNQTYQQNVTNSLSSPYDTGIGLDVNGVHANLIIEVGLNHTVRDHKNYMEIEMQSKVRVSVWGIYNQWPENHQKVLIPPILVPVPECDTSVVTPNYSPGACKAPKNATAPLHPNTPTKSGKACQSKLKDGSYAHVCGHGEMCGEGGFCVCMTGYTKINDTCQLGRAREIPYVIFDIPGKSTAKNTTTIIIVVVVAVVAFLGMMAVGFFIVKYRKYRARYGNHQLLGEEDSNAPDDPLDEEVEDDPPLDLST